MFYDFLVQLIMRRKNNAADPAMHYEFSESTRINEMVSGYGEQKKTFPEILNWLCCGNLFCCESLFYFRNLFYFESLFYFENLFYSEDVFYFEA